MSELQEVNIEEELSKSENENTPILSIKTDLNEEKNEEQSQQKNLLASLIQGSPSQSPTKESQNKVEDKDLSQDETDENIKTQASLEEENDNIDNSNIFNMSNVTADDAQNELNEQSTLNEQKESDFDSDEDSSDEDENSFYKNLEEDIDTNILKFYHPETENINYKELLTLSKITKNKKGEIIDPFHKTVPFMTQYEKAKILGQRAKQINNGSNPFVDVASNIIDGHTIALMELNQKKIPFIIRRPLPNGASEYWKVSDLKVII